MKIFKVKQFSQWAKGERLEDEALTLASAEIEKGMVDASLGGCVYKKRIPLTGRGKRGGARTIVAFRQGDNAFFVYGFAKNKRANISAKELKALKLLASKLLNLDRNALRKAIQANELIEVINNE
ncbi:MAG: type II toxin-antitoxin system RelE/ParE family toxin [Gammaproteobacteria bacterium]|jgi:hypothetical protein|nr:type II toxin-antitoxin system RelE/ParE family toxin [Gammaproteobacteria bacterium]